MKNDHHALFGLNYSFKRYSEVFFWGFVFCLTLMASCRSQKNDPVYEKLKHTEKIVFGKETYLGNIVHPDIENPDMEDPYKGIFHFVPLKGEIAITSDKKIDALVEMIARGKVINKFPLTMPFAEMVFLDNENNPIYLVSADLIFSCVTILDCEKENNNIIIDVKRHDFVKLLSCKDFVDFLYLFMLEHDRDETLRHKKCIDKILSGER